MLKGIYLTIPLLAKQVLSSTGIDTYLYLLQKPNNKRQDWIWHFHSL